MKILEKIKADPRIESAWDEGQDGKWVQLKPGFVLSFDGTHGIHERTWTEVNRKRSQITQCDCEDCKLGIELKNACANGLRW